MHELRAGLYARYSTELQSEASIPDQHRRGRELASSLGATVIEQFSDHAVSGSTMARPVIRDLLDAVQAGKINIVIAEALDRLSRDQADIAIFYKRLVYAGARLVTGAEGNINEMHMGLKGTMNALFIKDLIDKTQRGLEGRILEGRSAGGVSYGYRIVVREYDKHGQPRRGEREIDDDQAVIVRRIFQEYAAGMSPKAIASRLNADDVAGPRGGTRGFSTILGNKKRGTGILNNELYIGQLVWNRQRFVRDPDTRVRQARLNAREDWIVKEVPELRIVDQDLWGAVKARQKENAVEGEGVGMWDRRRPPASTLRADGLRRLRRRVFEDGANALRMLDSAQQGRGGVRQQAHDHLRRRRDGGPFMACRST